MDGVPVEGTYLRLTARSDGADGKLVSSGYHLYPAPRVNTAVVIGAGEALRLARARLRAPRGAATVRHEQLIRDLDGRLQLVWDVAFDSSHLRASVHANGPRRGRVRVEDARVFETQGSAVGTFVTGGAPGGVGVPQTGPLSDLLITGDGVETFTDAEGLFAIDAPDGSTVEAGLTGRAADVVDQDGADLTDSGVAGSPVELVLGGATSGETELAQVTAYEFVDRTRQYLEDNGVAEETLGAPLTTNVNLDDVCNAFFSPFERSINFFESGGGCNNSAIDSIIVHEYGHFIDDAEGGIFDGGLSEGWGPTTTPTASRTPERSPRLRSTCPGRSSRRSCSINSSRSRAATTSI